MTNHFVLVMPNLEKPRTGKTRPMTLKLAFLLFTPKDLFSKCSFFSSTNVGPTSSKLFLFRGHYAIFNVCLSDSGCKNASFMNKYKSLFLKLLGSGMVALKIRAITSDFQFLRLVDMLWFHATNRFVGRTAYLVTKRENERLMLTDNRIPVFLQKWGVHI